jgi:hypothetical protein
MDKPMYSLGNFINNERRKNRMMKTLKLGFLILMVTALAFALGNSAMALHDAATLKCMACHTMHASENGSYTGISVANGFDAAGTTPPPDTGVDHLLVQENVTDLCLACHYEGSPFTDSIGASPPAVFTIDGTQDIALPGGDYSTSNDLDGGAKSHNPGRQQYGGGAGTYSASIPEDTTLGMTPPGGVAVDRWDCVACHAPHQGDSGGSTGTYGDAKFRMLWSNPDGKGSGVEFTAAGATLTTDESDTNHTAYKGDTSTGDSVSLWCGACHGDFHNLAGGWLLHPSGLGIGSGLNTNYGTYSFLVPVEEPTATTSAVTTSGTSEVMCLTCHRSHAAATSAALPAANKNTNNMTRWDMTQPSGAGTGCNKCHAKGA